RGEEVRLFFGEEVVVVAADQLSPRVAEQLFGGAVEADEPELLRFFHEDHVRDVVDQRVEEALELVDRGGAGQTDAGFRGLGIVCVHESTVPDISYRVCQTEPGEDTPDFHTAAAYATLIVRSDARDHPWANIRSSIVGIAGGRRWKP